ncbi:hypothetical protein [Chlorobium sp.]|uniref:hypothetical protein n=1 Tax=Chlorobium sp. TaxID=1095 RepID=UPI002F40242A
MKKGTCSRFFWKAGVFAFDLPLFLPFCLPEMFEVAGRTISSFGIFQKRNLTLTHHSNPIFRRLLS